MEDHQLHNELMLCVACDEETSQWQNGEAHEGICGVMVGISQTCPFFHL